jgi:hypothetical protein
MFQDEWNKIVDDFTEWFGPSIIFAKVDGPENQYLASHYKIGSYPSFTFLDIEAS